MRFVVFGANGQLGRDLCQKLGGDVIAVDRARADLLQPEAVQSVLDQSRPDIVINCAAYNLVDRAEADGADAFAVNAMAVRSLARQCAARQTTIVHFSTDYVFGQDVTRSSPWTEEDTPGPVSTYGISKLAGEHFVRSICDRHFVIRTCGLYGAWGAGGKGGNFIETMLRLAGSGRPVRVVNDQVCTPTYTRDLADAVVRLLHTGRFGLYHITSSGCCSWHQLATAIFQLSGLQVEAHPISTQEFGAAARRPAYSVLSNSRCELLGLPPMRSWREALADYLNERKRPVNN